MTQTFQKWKRGEGEKSTEKFGEEKEEKTEKNKNRKKSSRFFFITDFFLGFLIFFFLTKNLEGLEKNHQNFFLNFSSNPKIIMYRKKRWFFSVQIIFLIFWFYKNKRKQKIKGGVFFLQLIRVCNNEKGKRDVFNDFFFHSLFFHTVQIIYRCYSFFFWLYSHNWFFDSAFAWSSFIQKGSSRSL